MTISYTPIDWTGADTDNDVPEEVRLRLAIENALGSGAIPYSAYPYTGQPSDTQTLTIGSDVYEFCTAAGSVAADGNIGVVIGANARATYDNLVAAVNATYREGVHPSLFQSDDETQAVANGTEDVVMVAVNGGDTATGTLYLFAATAPGGTKVPGAASSLALSDTASNGGPFAPTNLNLSRGVVAARAYNRAAIKHTVVAGDLSATQPLLIPVPFTPTMGHVQVHDAQGALRDAYVEATYPAAIGGQAFVGLNIAATTPTNTKRAVITIPVNDNDATVFAWALGRAMLVTGISFARGETAAAALTASIDKVTAATAGDAVQCATAVNIAGGTNGAIQAFTPDEAGGALPIALTALQGFLFTIAAGNGTVAPRVVTFFVDYVETVIATDVIHLDIAG